MAQVIGDKLCDTVNRSGTKLKLLFMFKEAQGVLWEFTLCSFYSDTSKDCWLGKQEQGSVAGKGVTEITGQGLQQEKHEY